MLQSAVKIQFAELWERRLVLDKTHVDHLKTLARPSILSEVNADSIVVWQTRDGIRRKEKQPVLRLEYHVAHFGARV